MGFFNGIMKSIVGGSDSQSQQTAQSGFALLPPQLQKAFTQYGTQITDAFKSNPVQTPNADQTQAFNLARTGVTPTPQSLQHDLSMLMNPYDDYVINNINREAQGQNSLVNQATTLAGQQGSNRSFLGTSDVEQNRLNSIGQFRQGQYNTAINQILGPLAGLKQQDIGNLLNIGQQQQQMPFNNLMTYGSLLGAIPQSGGSTSQGSSSSSSLNAGGLGSTIGAAGSILSMFSDIRLKENIEYIGERNGLPIYEFNYKGDGAKYVGVMAQDVERIMPEAVSEEEGYLTVDYSKLGFEMETVHV